MPIVDDLFLQKSSNTEHDRTPSEQSTGGTDASFFTSLFEGPHPTGTVFAKPEVSLLLTKASKHLSNSRNGFAKIIRSTKKGIDVEIIGNFPRELHNAQLTTQLMVKTLAKTIQCIDKLCNMQS
ncbi:type III secretion protein [Pseudomonas sp. HN11]|uniref:type III secretion protein n=1 Tax=Pseudomonas sp. HN11 TaxID=1344094 RepID=UPI001F1ACC09|nr:type III secretion protein [Pseudomonas sp. HN11]UII72263.1 type III secretion protein [Pseudomonas sp. HN11]